jgi:tyrosine decarboxylase / aspartate 1-decarboxylase
MCTKPLPIAKKAFQMFMDSNLGDSGLFLGSAQLEGQAISELAELLNGVEAAGFLVSGGTEANLLALQAAQNMAQKTHPEVVLPLSAHFSFSKICSLLKIKPVYADLDSNYKVNPQSVQECINQNTVAIVGTAGTAELGVVDPIGQLSKVALDHHVYLHVDAAFGGLVIPFLEEAEKFDFSLEGVQSVTVDPHKMGMAPIPAGGILFRTPKTLEFIKTETPYLTKQFSYTFSGTRSGASAAATWAVFNFLGRVGFGKIVNQCMSNTHYLAGQLKTAGYSLVVEPTLNIVAFRSGNTQTLYRKLLENDWLVSYVPRLDCIRIVVMPHVKKRHLEEFLKQLRRLA